MSLGGRVSPWRSAVEEGRSPLGRFRKPEPCFPRTYATWDAKKDENRFGSVKFRLEFSLCLFAFRLSVGNASLGVVLHWKATKVRTDTDHFTCKGYLLGYYDPHR